VRTNPNHASYDYGNVKKFATIENFIVRFPRSIGEYNLEGQDLNPVPNR